MGRNCSKFYYYFKRKVNKSLPEVRVVSYLVFSVQPFKISRVMFQINLLVNSDGPEWFSCRTGMYHCTGVLLPKV